MWTIEDMAKLNKEQGGTAFHTHPERTFDPKVYEAPDAVYFVVTVNKCPTCGGTHYWVGKFRTTGSSTGRVTGYKGAESLEQAHEFAAKMAVDKGTPLTPAVAEGGGASVN